MEIQFIDRKETYSVEMVDGELFLCVLMGGVGMWEEKIPLDDAMEQQFREDPSGLLPWVKRLRSEKSR
jgi:hypothetical protein